jgi:hypothetical protein
MPLNACCSSASSMTLWQLTTVTFTNS